MNKDNMETMVLTMWKGHNICKNRIVRVNDNVEKLERFLHLLHVITKVRYESTIERITMKNH